MSEQKQPLRVVQKPLLVDKNTRAPETLSAEEQGIRDGLLEALRYLRSAQEQLLEQRRWCRMERFGRLFLRPLPFVRTSLLITGLTYGWWWLGLGLGLQGAFSLGVLCTMVPILVMVWRAQGGEDWSGFLADIHCADEVILSMGEGHLLRWPVTHPEEGFEEGAAWRDVWSWVEARKAQLFVELTQRTWTNKREKVEDRI